MLSVFVHVVRTESVFSLWKGVSPVSKLSSPLAGLAALAGLLAGLAALAAVVSYSDASTIPSGSLLCAASPAWASTSAPFTP